MSNKMSIDMQQFENRAMQAEKQIEVLVKRVEQLEKSAKLHSSGLLQQEICIINYMLSCVCTALAINS